MFGVLKSDYTDVWSAFIYVPRAIPRRFNVKINKSDCSQLNVFHFKPFGNYHFFWFHENLRRLVARW